jgi:hypothetical protein
MTKTDRTAMMAPAEEDLKSARVLVKDAATILHFDLGQFSRLVYLSNELSTEIEYLKRHVSQLNEVNAS